jgi:hypothetical protein
MPQVSVSFPLPRHDTTKAAEIVAAIGREPAKQLTLHKSTEKGALETHALLKFDVTSEEDAQKVADALKPFGEVRNLP